MDELVHNQETTKVCMYEIHNHNICKKLGHEHMLPHYHEKKDCEKKHKKAKESDEDTDDSCSSSFETDKSVEEDPKLKEERINEKIVANRQHGLSMLKSIKPTE